MRKNIRFSSVVLGFGWLSVVTVNVVLLIACGGNKTILGGSGGQTADNRRQNVGGAPSGGDAESIDSILTHGDGATDTAGTAQNQQGNTNQTGSGDPSQQNDTGAKSGDQGSPTSLSLNAETLLWKRYRPFENGLMKGLQLDKNQVCLELGQQSCIDKVHLTVLGGNEPYVNAQYDVARAPTILTGIAVDRVVLAACTQRINLDKTLAAEAIVFKYFPFDGSAVSGEQVKNQTSSLYQRLLSREATADELQISQGILQVFNTPDKVALALCYMVGSQIEYILL